VLLLVVEDHDLVSALPNLALRIVHKAASKGVDLPVKSYSGVALTAINSVNSRCKRLSLPVDRISQNSAFGNLTNSLIVHATNQEGIHVH
jgi:hypothetical protein